MLKAIFELFTSQLGLPTNIILEYILTTLIGSIAYCIAWNASPGGPAGSLIHWGIRLIAFVAFWGCAYALIAFVKWIIQNWVIALIIVVSILSIICTIILLIKHHTKTQERM